MHNQAANSKVRTFLNIAAAIVIAVVAVVQLVCSVASLLPRSPIGDFGLSLDQAWRVGHIVPGSPADRADIRVGDFIDLRHQPIHDRYVFMGPAVPNPGDVTRIVVEHDGRRRTVTLRATRLQFSVADAASQATQVAGFVVFLSVAFILVIVRPGLMTWGLYLASAAAAWLLPGSPPNLPPKWMLPYILFWDNVLSAAGTLGLLVFCLCFPANEPVGWRMKVEKLLPYALIFFVTMGTVQDIDRFFSARPSTFVDWYQHFWDLTLTATALVGFYSLASAYKVSNALERQRIKWVLLGLASVCVALVTAALDFDGRLDAVPLWVKSGLESLIVVLPITLAYAIIRHRVIDVRFVVSRALVLGFIATVIAAVIVGLDWLFSTQLAGSRLQIAIYAGAALVVGFTLNGARQHIATLVDVLFYRQWHRTQQQANALSDSVHRAISKADLCQILPAGICEAYSLASVALFEKLTDGGLVRVADHGWLSGTLWHLLPDDRVAKRATSLRPTNIDSLAWTEEALPVGVARPSIMIPIVFGKQVWAILLCGAHENGTALDPDEIQALRRLCGDAGLVYGATASETEKIAAPLLRSESLGV